MSSDFAPELAKYPQSSPKPENTPKWGSRYLGIFIVNSTKFKCSVSHAKRSFYRAANGIFGKIGRLASEEVIVQLLLHKCMPIYYCMVLKFVP